MKKIGDTARQGDVLLVRVSARAVTPAHHEVPRDALGRIEVADGETSLHKHVIRTPGVCMLRAEGISDRVLTVAAEMAELITEGGERGPGLMRHPALKIPRGTYEIVIQREWAGEEVVNVAD